MIYRPLSQNERIRFYLEGYTGLGVTQRKAGGGWVDLPAGPHFARQFEPEKFHNKHFENWAGKVAKDSKYREEWTMKCIVADRSNTMSNKTNEQTPPAAMLPEAPASASAKLTSPAGVEWTVTMRDLSASGLLNKINRLEQELLGTGWQPAPTKGDVGQRDAATAPGDTTPVCPYHGPMKRSKKFNGWYCPQKMGDGSYCQEQVKD